MDLRIVVILFYGAVIEAKEFLRTGRGDAIRIPENSSDSSDEDTSQVLGLIIVEDNGNSESEESGQNFSLEEKLKTLPLTGSSKPNHIDTDSSGNSNADEYEDTDTDTSTDSESNFYHEDDYKEDVSGSTDLLDLIQNQSVLLRNRWKSCHRTGAKVCQKACSASYEDACEMDTCSRRLKRTMKTQCKRNCKSYFLDS